MTVFGGMWISSPGIFGLVMTTSSVVGDGIVTALARSILGNQTVKGRTVVRPRTRSTPTSNIPCVAPPSIINSACPAVRPVSKNRPLSSVRAVCSPICRLTPVNGSPSRRSTWPASAVTPAGACSAGRDRHGESGQSVRHGFPGLGVQLSSAAWPAAALAGADGSTRGDEGDGPLGASDAPPPAPDVVNSTSVGASGMPPASVSPINSTR